MRRASSLSYPAVVLTAHARASQISQEGQKIRTVDGSPHLSARNAAQDPAAAAHPQILGLLPFCSSCENLDRARWPGFAPAASAI
jgi:hypothetical protein